MAVLQYVQELFDDARFRAWNWVLCEGGRLECLVGLSFTRSTDQRL